MIAEILNNKIILTVVTALGSILLTIITQHILNRRGRLSYHVKHTKVGMSTDDVIFGSVKVTWNNNQIANLYLSVIELVNESMRDYENVIMRAFTNDTTLLTEKAEIVDSTHLLKWTDEFAKQLQVEPGQKPTEDQFALHGRERDYLIPVINRCQVIRLTFLNAAKNQNVPTIWLDMLHKGIKLEFKVAPNQFLGVPQPRAALVGSIIGIIIVGIIIVFNNVVWIAAVIAFIYGLFAQIPGAFALKLWSRLKHFFAD